MTHTPPILEDKIDWISDSLMLTCKGTHNQPKLSSVRFVGGPYFIRDQEIVQGIQVSTHPEDCGKKLYVVIVLQKANDTPTPLSASISLEWGNEKQEFKQSPISMKKGDFVIFKFKIELKCID